MARSLRRRPFRPLGLRLQRFSRDYIRNYLAPTQPRVHGSFDLPPSWRESAEEPLNWGASTPSQSAAFEPPADQPAATGLPGIPQFVQQAPPASVQPQRNAPPDLLRIMQIHETRRATLKAEADQRRIQRQNELGERPTPPPLTQRQRASFDYIKPLVVSDQPPQPEDDENQPDDFSDEEVSDEPTENMVAFSQSLTADTPPVQTSRVDEIAEDSATDSGPREDTGTSQPPFESASAPAPVETTPAQPTVQRATLASEPASFTPPSQATQINNPAEDAASLFAPATPSPAPFTPQLTLSQPYEAPVQEANQEVLSPSSSSAQVGQVQPSDSSVPSEPSQPPVSSTEVVPAQPYTTSAPPLQSQPSVSSAQAGQVQRSVQDPVPISSPTVRPAVQPTQPLTIRRVTSTPPAQAANVPERASTIPPDRPQRLTALDANAPAGPQSPSVSASQPSQGIISQPAAPKFSASTQPTIQRAPSTPASAIPGSQQSARSTEDSTISRAASVQPSIATPATPATPAPPANVPAPRPASRSQRAPLVESPASPSAPPAAPISPEAGGWQVLQRSPESTPTPEAISASTPRAVDSSFSSTSTPQIASSEPSARPVDAGAPPSLATSPARPETLPEMPPARLTSDNEPTVVRRTPEPSAQPSITRPAPLAAPESMTEASDVPASEAVQRFADPLPAVAPRPISESLSEDIAPSAPMVQPSDRTQPAPVQRSPEIALPSQGQSSATIAPPPANVAPAALQTASMPQSTIQRASPPDMQPLGDTQSDSGWYVPQAPTPSAPVPQSNIVQRAVDEPLFSQAAPNIGLPAQRTIAAPPQPNPTPAQIAQPLNVEPARASRVETRPTPTGLLQTDSPSPMAQSPTIRRVVDLNVSQPSVPASPQAAADTPPASASTPTQPFGNPTIRRASETNADQPSVAVQRRAQTASPAIPQVSSQSAPSSVQASRPPGQSIQRAPSEPSAAEGDVASANMSQSSQPENVASAFPTSVAQPTAPESSFIAPPNIAPAQPTSTASTGNIQRVIAQPETTTELFDQLSAPSNDAPLSGDKQFISESLFEQQITSANTPNQPTAQLTVQRYVEQTQPTAQRHTEPMQPTVQRYVEQTQPTAQRHAEPTQPTVQRYAEQSQRVSQSYSGHSQPSVQRRPVASEPSEKTYTSTAPSQYSAQPGLTVQRAASQAKSAPAVTRASADTTAIRRTADAPQGESTVSFPTYSSESVAPQTESEGQPDIYEAMVAAGMVKLGGSPSVEPSHEIIRRAVPRDPRVNSSVTEYRTAPRAETPPASVPASGSAEADLLGLLNLPSDTPVIGLQQSALSTQSAPPTSPSTVQRAPVKDAELAAETPDISPQQLQQPVQRQADVSQNIIQRAESSDDKNQSASESDVEELARKIYSIIRERLRIERERRDR